MIGEPFIELSEVNSTNIHAMEQIKANLAAHGTVYFAHNQFEGKGQRGKNWLSSAGKNLILSAVIDILPLNPMRPFSLQCLAALSCIELLQPLIPEGLAIKWPNDIYWNDRKAGGILIETIVQHNLPSMAVVGIGLNINEVNFSALNTKAVSLLQITGQIFEPVVLAKQLCISLNDRYNELLLNGGGAKQLKTYNSLLYKRHEEVHLRKNNTVSAYKILEVSEFGELIAVAGIEHRFNHGTIEWIMP